jgi:uncharacterized membrane protein
VTSLPLHPAVVHLPLGLAFVVPFLALVLAGALRGGRLPRSSWLLIVGLQAVLVVAGLAALETGQREEERVERVVAKALIGRHEALAESFLETAGVGLALALAALFLREGPGARWLRTSVIAVSFLTLALAVRVGHAGAEVVYRHGAAAAYVQPAASLAPSEATPAGPGD